MIKVLLADDENRILQFLQSSIHWNELNLELIGTANDGKTAVALATKYHADIVITDIRMPEISGLALCKHLKEINPDIQIILISGYAEFSYAREALQLGAIGYCLKPIDTEELITLLHTAIKKIKKERIVNADILLDYIETQNSIEIRHTLKELGLGRGPYYIAASSGMSNAHAKLGADFYCRLGKHKYLYFSSSPFLRDEAVKLISFSQKNAGIGLYSDPVPAEELRSAVETVIIFSYQYFLAGRSLLCEHAISDSLTTEMLSRLHTALQSKQKLYEFIFQLLQADLSMLFNISSAFQFYNIIYANNMIQPSEKMTEHYLYSFEQFVHEYGSFHYALKEILNTLAEEDPHSEDLSFASSGTFLKILKYINTNYNKDISLKLLSDTFHLNASYISTLIKNETNMTYSQYVTKLRIEKATSLLQTTDMSLTEISESIGFNDYFYFIKKYKKETGITPGSFRH